MVLATKAPTIAGVASVCANTTTSYITEGGKTGYVWKVSPGNIIVSGNGTRKVSVKWITPGAQTVSVSYNNTGPCPVLTTVKKVNVNGLPVPTITGPTLVCVDQMVNYYTEAGMKNYRWFIGGTGGNIYLGSKSLEIVADWTLPGDKYIQVTYTTPAGCKAVTPANLDVTAIWCTDSLTMGQVEKPKMNQFIVYPNPNDGLFTASIDCFCEQDCSVEVYDLMGVKIYNSGKLIISGKTLQTIDLRGVPEGFYSVVFRNNENIMVRKVIIRR
jgi:hypothetical protein